MPRILRGLSARDGGGLSVEDQARLTARAAEVGAMLGAMITSPSLSNPTTDLRPPTSDLLFLSDFCPLVLAQLPTSDVSFCSDLLPSASIC
jgi:hypothetical protein